MNEKGNSDTCGERIRLLRQSLNMNQKAFADSINVKQNTISQYERSATLPSIDVLTLIADKYDVSLDWLAGRTDNEKSEIATTYGRLLNLIVQFVTDKGSIPMYISGGIQYECDNNAPPGERYSVKSYSAKIEFRDIVLAQFFDEWNTMYQLNKKGVVNNSMFQAWLNGGIQQLMDVKYLKEHDEIYEQEKLAEFYKEQGINYGYASYSLAPDPDPTE